MMLWVLSVQQCQGGQSSTLWVELLCVSPSWYWSLSVERGASHVSVDIIGTWMHGCMHGCMAVVNHVCANRCRFSVGYLSHIGFTLCQSNHDELHVCYINAKIEHAKCLCNPYMQVYQLVQLLYWNTWEKQQNNHLTSQYKCNNYELWYRVFIFFSQKCYSLRINSILVFTQAWPSACFDLDV